VRICAEHRDENLDIPDPIQPATQDKVRENDLAVWLHYWGDYTADKQRSVFMRTAAALRNARIKLNARIAELEKELQVWQNKWRYAADASTRNTEQVLQLRTERDALAEKLREAVVLLQNLHDEHLHHRKDSPDGLHLYVNKPAGGCDTDCQACAVEKFIDGPGRPEATDRVCESSSPDQPPSTAPATAAEESPAELTTGEPSGPTLCPHGFYPNYCKHEDCVIFRESEDPDAR
jgi:hypothetical protein